MEPGAGGDHPKLIQRRFAHFVALESDHLWYQHIISVLGRDEKQSCALTLKCEDRSTFYARLESIRMDAPDELQKANGGTHAIRMAVIDITERKLIED